MNNKFPLSKEEIMFLAGLYSICFSVLKEFGISLSLSIGVAIILFFLSAVIWSLAKLWQTTDKRYKLFTNADGQELRKDIIEVKKSILVTHFSKSTPSDDYIALMLGRLNQGITITRLIPSSINKEDVDFKWLKKFEGLKYYIEKQVDGIFLPFDVIIYDDEKVEILFPISADSDHYSQGIEFNNSQVATMFRIALERIHRI